MSNHLRTFHLWIFSSVGPPTHTKTPPDLTWTLWTWMELCSGQTWRVFWGWASLALRMPSTDKRKSLPLFRGKLEMFLCPQKAVRQPGRSCRDSLIPRMPFKGIKTSLSVLPIEGVLRAGGLHRASLALRTSSRSNWSTVANVHAHLESLKCLTPDLIIHRLSVEVIIHGSNYPPVLASTGVPGIEPLRMLRHYLYKNIKELNCEKRYNKWSKQRYKTYSIILCLSTQK